MQTGHPFAAESADGTSVVSGYSLPNLSSVISRNPVLLNWADLPFVIHLSQSGGYNDNILGQPGSISSGNSKNVYGDLFESTSFGLSTKLDVGPQEFFANANYGFTKYRQDDFFNTANHFITAGVRFQITSRCSGLLTASSTESQSPLDELVTPGINTVNRQSVNETSTCLIYGHTSTILDSGFDTTKNTEALNSLNDYSSVHVRGGLAYALTELDSLSITGQFTQRDFSASQLRLGASSTTQVDYNLSYQRVFSPKLTASATGGITQLTTQGVGATSQTVPSYSANLSYRLTPKVAVNLAIGHTVGAPISVLATAQLSDTKSLSISYNFSPKLTFQASLAQSNTTAQGNASTAVLTGNTFALSNTSTSEGGSAIYEISPFIAATASIRHTERSYSGIEATTNLYTLGVSYNPY